MGMPMDLYVVRHGESEQNTIVNLGKQGDESLYTQETVTVPDRDWRLTAKGRQQADCIGKWIVNQQPLFDKYVVSPFTRTRETAATMSLPKARWEENRVVRERSWGEISTRSNTEFQTRYPNNWTFKQNDPLYWKPPAGESIADVAENRVHNFLTNLSRKAEAQSVIVVTHGDYMSALQLVMEDLSDEEFLDRQTDSNWKINNCTCHHYSRRDPVTGRTSGRMSWVQEATPVLDGNGKWTVETKPWRSFERGFLTNGDLTGLVHSVARHLDQYRPDTPTAAK